MSELLIKPTFLPNKGINLDKPEEFLKNQFSTGDSRNMEFYDELLQGRQGLQKFDTAVLSDDVLLIDNFIEFSSTRHLLVCTCKDIYQYDFSNTRFTILTPTYTTGLISIGTGDLTVVIGSGTSWDTELAAGDYIKIGTGAIHTGSTWYEIDSVDSATQVTLTTAAVYTAAWSGYVARTIFQGTSTDFWRARAFMDENFTETWIATNGVDTPVRWSGSGQVAPLATVPTGFTSAKFIEVYKDRLCFGWTVEGGGNQPQRVRWSAVADCETWDDTHFHDFMEEGTWITQMGIMSDYWVVFREEDAYIGRYIGGDYIFDFEKSSSCAGVWGQNSLVIRQKDAFYYGPDSKFHKWDLLTDSIITESIFPHTSEYNPNLEQHIYGYNVSWKNQIRWFCPYSDATYNNECVVYDFLYDIVQIWEYQQTQGCCCIGEYLRTTDLYVDDSVWGEYYVDEQEGFWDDRSFLDDAPHLVYGGYDGYIREADTGDDDDGTAFNRTFESLRDNFGLPQENKRLRKQQIWLESSTTGSVAVTLKLDDSNSYDAKTNTISLINANRDIIKKDITWNKTAQNFKTKITASVHWAMLGFLNYVHPKGKTSR